MGIARVQHLIMIMQTCIIIQCINIMIEKLKIKFEITDYN